MPKPFREVVAMTPAELRHKPVQIGIPGSVTEREYDMMGVGAPTWWLSADAPTPTLLESDTAFHQGGQICPLFWRLGHLGTGEYQDGYGVKIPPSNIQELHLDEACTFATKVATHLLG